MNFSIGNAVFVNEQIVFTLGGFLRMTIIDYVL